MNRRAFSKLSVVFPAVITLVSVSQLLGEETELAPVEVSATLNESFDTELEMLGGDTCPDCDCTRSACCCGRYVDWSTVPQSIRPMPRPGNFPIPRTGCGFYSLYDQVTGQYRDAPPKTGYSPIAMMPPSFFDADFRYVESKDYCERTLSEKLKRIPVTDCLTFSSGGQVWARYMNEHNRQLTERDNSYTLARVRAYGDLMYGDKVRVFGEYLWADSFSEDLAPLPIDVNRGDVLNLFMDLKLFDYDGHPVYARVGRQELLLGSQRLVSSLDWANVRRTFDGARVFRRGEKWDVDLFYSAFVPPNPNGLDQLDDNRELGGAWATYRPQKGHFADFYYMYADDSRRVAQLDGDAKIVRSPTEVHTLGTRYAGDKCGYLWDCELAMQFGNKNAEDLFAGMATVGVGRNFKDSCCWSPTLWLYYDYASGDQDPTSGAANTFNQLYPFGHYYLGWLDLVGRQNIHDLNAHLFFYPQPWITVWLQYHHFRLDKSRDALYNAGGVAIRRDPSGAAGTNVGDEFDIVLNFHLARNTDILTGYSHMFGGSFLKNTPGASNAELFYLMFQQRW